MSVSIKGGLSVNLLDVDSLNNSKINLSNNITGNGYTTAIIEPDPGTIIGSRLRKTLDVSQNFRVRVGTDKIVWQDTFNHSVLNNNKYNATTTTQTISVNNGVLSLNSNNIVSSPGPFSLVNTFKTFSIFNQYPTYFDIFASLSAPPQSNSIIEFGFGLASGTNAPSDGVFFRVSGGTLNTVLNYNGFETGSTNVFVPVSGVSYHYLIVVRQNKCEFWVNDILVSNLQVYSGSSTVSNSLPILLRNYNSGGTVPNAIQLNVAQMAVSLGDMDGGKDWKTAMVTNAQSSIYAPDGQPAASTGMSTSYFVNSTTPTAIALSNTVPGYSTLGGMFAFAAPAGAETDYVLFAYQNPVGSASIPGKNLIITGLKIDSMVSGATAGANPTLLQWTIGVGGTNASLTEVDSVTVGTRATRRASLGTQVIAASAVVGQNCDRNIECEFSTPLMVEPGTYCHIILKIPFGLATSNETIRGIVEINGYFE